MGWGTRWDMNQAVTPVALANIINPTAETLGGDGFLVFQCNTCGDILDPLTDSYEVLCDHAKQNDWLIKYHTGKAGYEVKCCDCR